MTGQETWPSTRVLKEAWSFEIIWRLSQTKIMRYIFLHAAKRNVDSKTTSFSLLPSRDFSIKLPFMATGLDSRAAKDTGSAATNNDHDSYSGLHIIHAGLFRTATKSMAFAYRELGYKAHHGLDDVLNNPWTQLEHAAEATWPGVQGSQPRAKLTREEWDKVWAPFEVCTDLGSMFVPELIKVYPGAKVVIVKRDPDRWWASFKTELLDTLWHPRAWLINWITWNIIRCRAPFAMMKLHLGFFDVQDRADIDAVAKQKYEEYYGEILRAVPAERRLVYEMGSGWEPLCKFLDKPIPNKPFPRVNERADHDQGEKERRRTVMNALYWVLVPILVSGAAMGIASSVYWGR